MNIKKIIALIIALIIIFVVGNELFKTEDSSENKIVDTSSGFSTIEVETTPTTDPTITPSQDAEKIQTSGGDTSSNDDYEYNLNKIQQGLGSEKKEDKEFIIDDSQNKEECLAAAFEYGKSGSQKFIVTESRNNNNELTGYSVQFQNE